MTDLRVTHTLLIPEEELEWSFSPSPGPGGQHANKTSTRAELAWNLERSRVLSPAQRERIRRELHNRIDARGTLRIASSTHRSQLRNREEASRRLAELVGDALRPVKKR
ncbi:MAG TPA: alternative ribosome rescue aminoacyl-tRNA hydrolase ArfB, partial [Actinomycetota bacterium]|nr:alternative ribosome rescue aminoacyl-tRNA hydrolase ArfB [Actinomycetota bacterium]